MQVDLIQERVSKGLCPICKVEIDSKNSDNYKLVEYKGDLVTVCKQHPGGENGNT
jgi:hypothetical protein